MPKLQHRITALERANIKVKKESSNERTKIHQQSAAQNGTGMVRCPHKIWHEIGNSRFQTACFLYLFHICYGGNFLSFLSRSGLYALGERYFHHEKT